MLTFSGVEYSGNAQLRSSYLDGGCSTLIGQVFKIQNMTFTQILPFFSGEIVLGHPIA
jgi:hypothetical protein